MIMVFQKVFVYFRIIRYDHTRPKQPAVKSTPAQRILNPTPAQRVLNPTPAQRTLNPLQKRTEKSELKMTSLKKGGQTKTPEQPSTPKPPELWVKATEFVPGKPYVCSSSKFIVMFDSHRKTMCMSLK